MREVCQVKIEPFDSSRLPSQWKLVGVVAHLRGRDHLVHRHGQVGHAEHGAVLGGNVVERVRHDHAGGARRVDHDRVGPARQVIRKVFDEQPRHVVVAAADARAHVHADGVAAVKIGDRIGERRRQARPVLRQ